MFFNLLLVTFLISLLVSALVARMFTEPATRILDRIMADKISTAWVTYLKFAIYVVGISSGVRINELEKYVNPPAYYNPHGPAPAILELTPERWVIEVYGTIINSLQGLAGVLLVFFIFALIAFVLVRIFEMKRDKGRHEPPPLPS